ncbi:MAG: AAA family ATPase [Elusimicrobia bacterium]|nr:AAA family ATPase [Elusimicrobiota bacterium]
MDRWEIRPAPSAEDPRRHLLLLRGGAADVAAVLKKFGALCGRPTPLDGEEFNLSFVLHRVSPEAREKLDAWLGRMSPKPAAPPPPPAPAIPPPPVLPPIPTPPAAKEPLISIGPEAAPATPAPSAAPRAAELPASAVEASSSTSLTDELRTDWTFETLLVGAYNRFAHAAAMSVVSSPGSMYNPLFLYGVPGTGKSHLLHAIANSMSKGLGGASLLATSGARLSRAVGSAAAGGSMAAVEKKAADSTALFVDDVHLMAVTDANKGPLAKLFKSFFDGGRQVVVTSMYPPKALGALEEALKLSFSKGWSVDLKIPSPSVQRDLVGAVADRVGAEFSGDEIGALADRLAAWGYQDMALWIKRLAALRAMLAAAGRPAPLPDLLKLIYEPIVAGSEAPPPATAGTAFAPPAAPAGAPPLAVIAPSGQEGLVAYAAKMFHETGGKHGFTRAYGYARLETYDAAQQVGVPFQIADLCHGAGATRALVVGPGPDSPLAARAGEFGHAVRRILGSCGVATGWIPHAQLRLEAHYVNAHLDFEK